MGSETTRLEEIGFYTLEDARVEQASSTSPMWRTEVLITRACNFNCPYCRHVGAHKSIDEVKYLIDLWSETGLKNIRFSGGEPTLLPDLEATVRYARQKGAVRVAVSTNGSAAWSLYERLIEAGVDDFSVSLDACCASEGDKMAGGIYGAWNSVVENIQKLSARVYTTVGVVITPETAPQLTETVMFAHGLGVSDIRIITAAQWDGEIIINIPQKVLDQHPILQYRINHLRNGRHVRGIQSSDANRCGLTVDDSAVMGNNHYPCIIYMREGGEAIGGIGPNMRAERIKWSKNHDTHCDPICKASCLDVCIDYNNKFKESHDA